MAVVLSGLIVLCAVAAAWRFGRPTGLAETLRDAPVELGDAKAALDAAKKSGENTDVSIAGKPVLVRKLAGKLRYECTPWEESDRGGSYMIELFFKKDTGTVNVVHHDYSSSRWDLEGPETAKSVGTLDVAYKPRRKTNYARYVGLESADDHFRVRLLVEDKILEGGDKGKAQMQWLLSDGDIDVSSYRCEKK